MELFEQLGTILKPHAEAVSKGLDSDTAEKIFLSNEESFMNLIQIPEMYETVQSDGGAGN